MDIQASLNDANVLVFIKQAHFRLPSLYGIDNASTQSFSF